MRYFCSLVVALCLATTLQAQQPDTTHGKSIKPIVYTSLMVGGISGAFVTKALGHPIDTDPCANGKSVCLTGTYKDGWTTKAMFSDKAWHSLASYTLADAGMDMGVTPWKASVLTLGVGILFEVQQGYISKYDIGADAVGVSAAWLKHRFFNRRK